MEVDALPQLNTPKHIKRNKRRTIQIYNQKRKVKISIPSIFSLFVVVVIFFFQKN